jgi:hypothetical protein
MKIELLIMLMTNNNNISSCLMQDDNFELELFWSGQKVLNYLQQVP